MSKTMTDQDPAQTLREEILSEAQRESQEIIDCARQEAEGLLVRAASEADRTRLERINQARQEAAHRKELILATVPVEAGRLRSIHIEELLDSIRTEISRRLAFREGFNYPRSVVVLAAEAVSRMSGETFKVRIPLEDRAILGEGVADEITHHVRRSPVTIVIFYDPGITENGPIVEDGEVRQIWDNRLTVRLERLWPELRRQIALEGSLVSISEKSGEGP